MSEIINIPLGGVSNEPSDYIAEDGALSVSINAIKHNGSVRPLMPGTRADIPLPKGADVVAIHEVGNMKHYILVEDRQQQITGAPVIEPRIYIYYTNLEGRVKVWWDSNKPEDFEGAYAWLKVKGKNQRIAYGEPIEVPSSEALASEDISVIGIVGEDKLNIDIYQYRVNIREIPENPAPDEEPTPDEEEQPGTEPIPGDDPSSPDGKYVVSYIDTSNQTSGEIGRFSKPVLGVTAIGNVLTIVCENAPVAHAIWKEDAYTYLGITLGNISAFPYLLSKPMGVEEIWRDLGVKIGGLDLFTNDEEAKKWKDLFKGGASDLVLEDQYKKFVYDKVFGIINTAHNTLTQNGYFYAPFFVRFALRMYDGSHIMHTPPQLMIAGAAGKPLLGVQHTGTEILYPYLEPVFCASRLCADIKLTDCDRWDELITHLDVFVSAPIVGYTDSVDAIKTIGIANLPYHEGDPENGVLAEVGSPMPQYDGLYTKDRKVISNLYQDYLENAIYRGLSLVYKTLLASKSYTFRLPGTGTRYILVKAKSYTSVKVNGNDISLKEIKGTDVIGAYGDKTITLNDIGITNLSEYKYFTHDSVELKQLKIYTRNQTSTEIVIVGFNMDIMDIRSTNITWAIDIQRADGTNYYDAIADNNAYYLAKSFKIEDLKTNDGKWGRNGDLAIEEYDLSNITTKKTLTDNGQMREQSKVDILPVSYNNRLTTVVKSQTMPTSSALVDFCTQQTEDLMTYPNGADKYFIVEAWVKCYTDGQTVYRKLDIGNFTDTIAYADFIRYFYYPHSSATELVVNAIDKNDNRVVLSYILEPHKLMNGAYAFNKFEPIVPKYKAEYTSVEDLEEDAYIKNARNGAREVVYGNMVKVSSVANPFHFSEVNQVTLPSGKISGLSTTAKALSQGQFGAFPLYCFSDNGIWALEVSSEGTYSAKQPVSRAVCTNPDSITQTEGSVLFVTKRGLMSIEGSNVSCISEELHGHNVTDALDQLNKVKQMAGFTGMVIPDHVEGWMQKARFLYDDKQQHLYAFREDDDLAYVYSLTDQAWGMMQNDMAHPLPSYTDALVVTREDENGMRKVVNMSDYAQCGSTQKSLIVTRPLTMGVADGYKTIEALVTRGVLDKDDAKMVIWASNDLKTWAIVATSTTSWYRGKSGTPYKYYRIGLLLDWEDGDSINAISADITPRLNNRLR